MLTDDRIKELWNASTKFINGYGQVEIMQFARAVEAEASPASVPVVTDRMVSAFHHALTDNTIGREELDKIKTGLRAALSAAPTPPVSEARWLPIETAPKDGTRIIVVSETGNVWCGVYWEKRPRAGERWTSLIGPLRFAPTYWMPLPKAPAMQEDKS